MSRAPGDAERKPGATKLPIDGTIVPSAQHSTDDNLRSADENSKRSLDAIGSDSISNGETLDIWKATGEFELASDDKAQLIDGLTVEYSSEQPATASRRDKQTAVPSIPGFQIIEELGRGAFGVVYKAVDEMLQRQVAIKVPLLRDPKLRESYIAEARKAVSLEHPNIVPIYHVGITTDDQPFVVQKLIDGPNLRKVLNESKGLPILETVRLIREIALAIDAAHIAGMVHRDLKPENLLIDARGQPWVADFGLALAEDDQNQHRGEIAGTPSYMSPEQLMGRADWLDGRSDIWSIGVMMYEMIVGKLPFDGSTFHSLKEQIIEREPRPIHQRVPDVPADLDHVFQKCCAKKVTDRFASGRDLAADLDLFLANTQLTEDYSPSSFRSLYTTLDNARPTRKLGQSSGGRLASTKIQTHRTMIHKTIEISSRAALPVALLFCGISILGAALLFWKSGPLANRTNQSSELASTQSSSIPDVAIAPTLSSIPVTDASVSTAQATLAEANDSDLTSLSPLATPTQELPETSDEPTESATPTLLPIERPFRVAIDGSGTHTSLQAAIDDAEPDEVILIAAGSLRESVNINKNIELRGEAAATTSLISVNRPCLSVAASVKLIVTDLSLFSQGNATNTIEVSGGAIKLQNCEVVAATFDCIKLWENSIALIINCVLETEEHPAIRAESGCQLEARDSTFKFTGNAIRQKAGIQAVDSLSRIFKCDFQGRCEAAIHLRDAVSKESLVQNCSFAGATSGVYLDNCKKVQIAGSLNNPSLFVDCTNPIIGKASSGHIENVKLTQQGNPRDIGLQFIEGSDFKIRDILVNGYEIGVGSLTSTLDIEGGKIVRCNNGALSDSSNCTFNYIDMTELTEVGLLSTGLNNNIDASNVTVSGGAVGIWAMAGQHQLDSFHFENLDTAIVVGCTESIVQEFSESSMLTPFRMKFRPKVDFQQRPKVASQGLAFKSIVTAVRFLGPGQTRIQKVDPEPAAELKLLDIFGNLRASSGGLENLDVEEILK